MNRLFGKQTQWTLCNMMSILVATGCQYPSSTTAAQSLPQPIAKTMVAQQLMIKFRPNTITCDATGVAKLSSATQVPLEYVRPMSGDACVIRQLAQGATDFFRGKELLKQQPFVEWLEEDKKMKDLGPSEHDFHPL